MIQGSQDDSGPLFSVIIPTYNRPELLAEAITSVLNQTVGDLECLVIDDHSPQPVEAPMTDPRLKIIRHDINRGGTVARNTGLAHARGTFVAFLDDDDVWTPRRLEYALAGLKSAPVTVCLRAGFDQSVGAPMNLNGDVRHKIANGFTPHLGQTALRRSIAPTFDERFDASEDVDWWIRLAHSARVSTVSELGLRYRQHDGPRNLNDTGARLAGGRLLLSVHADYFRSHRRAHSFRWKRIGLASTRVGDSAGARRAFVRAMRLWPDPSAAVHALRTLRRSS